MFHNQPVPSFLIGDRHVSSGEPCFVIAEIGCNHDGDLTLAHRMIDEAARAGADAVKFQTFRTVDLVSDTAEKAQYQKRTTGDGSQAEMLARLELPAGAFRELSDHCHTAGVEFISTAFDPGSLDLVIHLKPSVLKWPSGEIDNVPMLRQAARSALPIILSTGMATLAEIDAALAVLDAAKSGPVAILQCVSQYPAPIEDQNLRTIPEMARRFGRVTGFSDHTLGPWAAIAARALGMAILEKHITVDRTAEGPDHSASMEPDAFAEMVAALRAVERGLGDGHKRPVESELDTRAIARKSLFYTRAIAAGTVIREADIVAKRPGGGISPARFDQISGRTLCRDVAAGALIEPNDVA